MYTGGCTEPHSVQEHGTEPSTACDRSERQHSRCPDGIVSQGQKPSAGQGSLEDDLQLNTPGF